MAFDGREALGLMSVVGHASAGLAARVCGVAALIDIFPTYIQSVRHLEVAGLHSSRRQVSLPRYSIHTAH
jgi:hypothetical protein